MGEIFGIYLFLWIIVLVIVLVIQAHLADRFQKIVEMKGYKEYRVWAWVFWLGVIGMLMTIALPDKSSEEPHSYSNNQKESNDIAEELPEL